MSVPTDSEMIRVLAENGMEWWWCDATTYPFHEGWDAPKGRRRKHWNPLSSVSDTIHILSKVRESNTVEIETGLGQPWSVRIGTRDYVQGDDFARTVSLAIYRVLTEPLS